MAIKPRCRVLGCTGFAQRQSSLCAVHKRYVDSAPPAGDDEADRFADRVRRQEAEARAAAAAEFRERLATGRYGDLLGDRLGGLVKEASAAAGVGDELGMLRLVFAELMLGDVDLETKVKLMSRLSNAIFAAAKVQRLLTGQLADGLTDAITTILLEIEGDAA